MMAKAHMTFGQMSQDNYKYIYKIHAPKYFKANTNFVKEWLFTLCTLISKKRVPILDKFFFAWYLFLKIGLIG